MKMVDTSLVKRFLGLIFGLVFGASAVLAADPPLIGPVPPPVPPSNEGTEPIELGVQAGILYMMGVPPLAALDATGGGMTQIDPPTLQLDATDNTVVDSVIDDLAGEVDHDNKLVMIAAGFSDQVIADALSDLRDKRIKANAAKAETDPKLQSELEELAELGNLEAQATLDRIDANKKIRKAVKKAMSDPKAKEAMLKIAGDEIRNAIKSAEAKAAKQPQKPPAKGTHKPKTPTTIGSIPASGAGAAVAATSIATMDTVLIGAAAASVSLPIMLPAVNFENDETAQTAAILYFMGVPTPAIEAILSQGAGGLGQLGLILHAMGIPPDHIAGTLAKFGEAAAQQESEAGSVMLPNGKIVSRLEAAFILIFGVSLDELEAALNDQPDSVLGDLAGEVDHNNRLVMVAAGFSDEVIGHALDRLQDRRIESNAARAETDTAFKHELEELAALGNLEARATLDILTKNKAIKSAVRKALADPEQRDKFMRVASPEIRQAILDAEAARKEAGGEGILNDLENAGSSLMPGGNAASVDSGVLGAAPTGLGRPSGLNPNGASNVNDSQLREAMGRSVGRRPVGGQEHPSGYSPSVPKSEPRPPSGSIIFSVPGSR